MKTGLKPKRHMAKQTQVHAVKTKENNIKAVLGTALSQDELKIMSSEMDLSDKSFYTNGTILKLNPMCVQKIHLNSIVLAYFTLEILWFHSIPLLPSSDLFHLPVMPLSIMSILAKQVFTCSLVQRLQIEQLCN